MHEIRMYVERLFQDKVLSEENIELKEEIYGNLVARYEDYVASGMPEDEALAQTKASITSIDDVLQGEEAACSEQETLPGNDGALKGSGAVCDGAAGSEQGSVSEDAAQSTFVVDRVASDTVSAASEATIPLSQDALKGEGTGASAQGSSGNADAGAADASSGTSSDPHKKWLPYAIIAAVVVCVLAIAIAVSSCVDDAEDRDDADRSGAGQTAAVDNEGQTQAASTKGPGENQGGNAHADDAIVVDADGTVRYDGEPADDLLMAVVNSDSAAIAAHTPLNLSSVKDVEAALRDLPLAEWLTNVDAAGKTGTLTISYEAVSERVDGDSIDAALVYNAAALMCASSEIDTIDVSVTDAEDVRERDRGDRYVFTRRMLEQQFGGALANDLVTDAGWKTLKEEHLYMSNFIDQTVDKAERE